MDFRWNTLIKDDILFVINIIIHTHGHERTETEREMGGGYVKTFTGSDILL